VKNTVDHAVVVTVVQFAKLVQLPKHQLLVHHVHVEKNITDHAVVVNMMNAQFARNAQPQKHHVQLAHAG
jgi:hypothetical protein